MTHDSTELPRRVMLAQQQALGPLTREQLGELHGDVWDTDEMRERFEVQGFLAPYVVVRRRADGVVGSLEFQHHDRFYYNFTPD